MPFTRLCSRKWLSSYRFDFSWFSVTDLFKKILLVCSIFPYQWALSLFLTFLSSKREKNNIFNYFQEAIRSFWIHPRVKLDFPPGGLWTLTEVLTSSVGVFFGWANPAVVWGALLEACCRGWGLFCFLGAGSELSQPREMLLLPPGAWWTLTEVVPSECFEKSIQKLYTIQKMNWLFILWPLSISLIVFLKLAKGTIFDRNITFMATRWS